MTARPSRRTFVIAATAGIVCVAGAVGALYVAAGPSGNSGACAVDRARLARLRPLAQGEVAALAVAEAPARLPPLAFKGAAGEARALPDFAGRTILLNLWATWCVPCRQEMPALDRLQATLGGQRFEVAAINIDTRNLERPKAWLAEAGITHLTAYADPQAGVFQDLKQAGKVVGLPTSLLIDPAGCEIAALSGPADWSSPEAIAFIRAAMDR